MLSFIPDELDIEYLEDTYMLSTSNFVAEKSENIQYIVLTISFPILFIVFYKIIEKIKHKLNEKFERILDGIFLFIIITLSINIIFIVRNIFIKETILYDNFILAIFLLIISILLIIFYQKINNIDKLKKYQKIINWICIFIVTLTTVLVGYEHINNSYAQSTYDVHHVDAYFYPVYKTLFGLTPGIDFNSIYGYYSYFFSMIMRNNGKN